MSIIRAPRPGRGWVAIPNATIRDRRLSWKDRGILAYILSLPDDAETTIAKLTEAGPDGTDGTRAALKRLDECGYVKRVKLRTPEGTWSTKTFVYDTPEAAEQAAAQQESLDIPAGQDQTGFSDVVDEPSGVSAGQDQVGFTSTAEPTWLNRVGKDPSIKKTKSKDQPASGQPPAGPSPAEVLALAVVGGLEKVNPTLAQVVGRPQLRDACRPLVDLGWTALMLEAWVVSPAQTWGGVGGGVVIHRLGQLGRPPERPRSAEPTPQNLCPEHPGQKMRAGTCDLCLRERTSGPPPGFVAARRSARPEPDLEGATTDA